MKVKTEVRNVSLFFIFQMFVDNKSVSETHFKAWFTPNVFTAHKRSLRRLCFHMCLVVHMGGVFPIAFLDTHISGQTHTPYPVHAGIHPPRTQCMMGYGHKWVVRMPLECILVAQFFAPFRNRLNEFLW